MKKLFFTDIVLILLTLIGLYYLFSFSKIDLNYAIFIFAIYILSKIIGYIILPYNKFKVFLDFLVDSSKNKYLSGFEIFKSVLVLLLFLGFIFIDPSYWIVESILVVSMRIWGYNYVNNN